MRILILGRLGLLGHEMERAFHEEDIVAFDRAELDVTDREKVFETFMTVQPDTVINCTGYTNVDKAEEEHEVADAINGYAVGVLAQACREIDATFVHFSTDYVFNGQKKKGYDEDDALDPLNAYGRSKALGEKLLHDEMDSLDELNPIEGKYFLIRTSWLFGKHGKNFVDTMLELGKEKKELKVVSDQHGKPTYARDLAEQVKWLIKSHEYDAGIYHITNEGATTWDRFAHKIFELAKMDVNVVACTSAEFPRAAKRPLYSVLNNHKLPPLRTWMEALEDYLNQ